MSYKGSTFIGKLEELSLSGLPLELVVGVGGGVYSCGRSIEEDSILITQQPKAVEGLEKRMEIMRLKGSIGRFCIHSSFSIQDKGVLWM